MRAKKQTSNTIAVIPKTPDAIAGAATFQNAPFSKSFSTFSGFSSPPIMVVVVIAPVVVRVVKNAVVSIVASVAVVVVTVTVAVVVEYVVDVVNSVVVVVVVVVGSSKSPKIIVYSNYIFSENIENLSNNFGA